MAVAARDKTVVPEIAAQIAATEPMTPITPQIVGVMEAGQRTIRTDGCRKAKPGEPLKLEVTYPFQVRRGSRSTTDDLEVFTAVRLSGANKAGPIKVTYSVPIAGGGGRLRQTAVAPVPLCLDNAIVVNFGYRAARSAGNTTPVAEIRESVRGPGLQRYRLVTAAGRLVVPERRKHTLSVIAKAAVTPPA
jgi:hypothetical protein